ncbi:MAG: amidase [Deltaproteobacteria bacterium]|nr:amidase [Deltaproteobacteria bacterium]
MESVWYDSAIELAKKIRSRDLSPVELVEATLGRIEAVNPKINAIVALRAEEALAEAKALAERMAAGEDAGPLAGIPFAVKDLEDTAGMVTSFGSVPFKDNLVKNDSVQVGRLKRAGAIVVGKTNSPEFGFTGFPKNRLYGVTRNPWNLDRTPGGSSGGAAAAVAAGMVPLATGSDAGGSIRIPASYSGCFGFKPTYGRIHLGPFDPLTTTRTWTLGPLTRTVSDAALYMDVACGYHPADPDSLPRPEVSYLGTLDRMLPPLKIGFSTDLGYARVQRDVAAIGEDALKTFEEMGHRVELWDGQLPEVSKAWSELMGVELYGQLYDNLEQVRSQLGRSMMAAVDHARDLPAEEHVFNLKLRTALNRALLSFFDTYDLLITPTMPTEAFGAEGPPPTEIDGHPIPILLAVAFTYPFNLSGHPAATVRAGLTESGLPAGLQIVGPRHRDDLVLRVAHAFEQARPWNDHWPEL